MPEHPGWAQALDTALDAAEPLAGEPGVADGLGEAGGMPHMTQ
ncbi:hypothetical protein [Actinomadura napierensis]|uniref:Uncharacterized protein n=1 Tax=Actinomadura napierensis TaxID=267854 RepID=A0ABN2Z4K5_9ACTN